MSRVIVPFLTQSIVDVGINNQDINFIYLILAAQMMLFVNRMTVDFICSWIPQGKVTAIVGTSGSGKTTLIKLLLGFYPPTSGSIKIGETDLLNYRQNWWRSKWGP